MLYYRKWTKLPGTRWIGRDETGKSHDVKKDDTVGTCSVAIARHSYCGHIYMAPILVVAYLIRRMDVCGQCCMVNNGEAKTSRALRSTA